MDHQEETNFSTFITLNPRVLCPQEPVVRLLLLAIEVGVTVAFKSPQLPPFCIAIPLYTCII